MLAGSLDYAGAALLVSRAAGRAGAGLVTLAVPESLQPLFAAKVVEATTMALPEDDVEEVLSIIRDTCTSRTQVVNPMPPIMEPGEFFMPYPLEVEVGGATVFVVPVDRYERL